MGYENEQLNKEIIALYKEKKEYNEQIEEINNYKDCRINDLQKNINQLREEQKENDKNNNNLCKTLRESNNKIKELEKYKNKYDLLEKKMNKLKKEKDTLERAKSNLEFENKEINKENVYLNKQIELLNYKLDISHQYQEMYNNNNYTNELKKNISDLNDQIGIFKNKEKEMLNKINELENEKIFLIKENEKLNKKIEENNESKSNKLKKY